jgi:hypothetical protein
MKLKLLFFLIAVLFLFWFCFLLNATTYAASGNDISRHYSIQNQFNELRLKIEGALRLHNTHANLEYSSQLSQSYPYTTIIPYVTTAGNNRANLGLNNYSQISFLKGVNPTANVLVGLLDKDGNVAGAGAYSVNSNEMKQVNGILADLGATVDTGWLLIFSDEPLTAWVSVIFNSTNDPSIESGIADQIFKPDAFVESIGTRILLLSSTKVGLFQSSLVVVNVGSEDGDISVKLYDSVGSLLVTKTAHVKMNGMYVDDDVRDVVAGTYGPIVVEVQDLVPDNNLAPRIIVNSIVKSVNGTGAFFQGFALPQTNTKSIAGTWEGTMTGSLINASVRMMLVQERDMLYGTFDVLDGSFPTMQKNFLICGEILNNNYLISLQNAFDTDPNITFFTLRLYISALSSSTMEGVMLYHDKQQRGDAGKLTLNMVVGQ